MAGGWLTGPWLDWGAAALVAAAAGLVAWAATARVVGWLTRRAILDRPNERSSHAAPVPRGGGLGVLAGLLPAWALVSAAAGGPAWRWAALAGAAVLASVSWRDDRGHVPAGIRLLAQAAAVLPAAALLPGPVLQGLAPPWLDLAFAVVAWIWFVNLYNFMDGIDGITGVETAAIGAGIALMAALSGTADEGALGLVLAAVAAGFLAWNWHPARVFLGDVGSVPLGYLAGGLLLALAARGEWAAALALPLYHLADATLTLLRRAFRGAAVWRAHREHFYQRAVQRGLSHARVAGVVAALGALLVLCAGWSVAMPAAALATAAAATAAVLAGLGRRR